MIFSTPPPFPRHFSARLAKSCSEDDGEKATHICQSDMCNDQESRPRQLLVPWDLCELSRHTRTTPDNPHCFGVIHAPRSSLLNAPGGHLRAPPNADRHHPSLVLQRRPHWLGGWVAHWQVCRLTSCLLLLHMHRVIPKLTLHGVPCLSSNGLRSAETGLVSCRYTRYCPGFTRVRVPIL